MASTSQITLVAAGIWQRAAAHSGLWRGLAPVRRVWTAAERGVLSVTASTASDGADRRVEKVVQESWLFRTADLVLHAIAQSWDDSVVVDRARPLTDGITRAPLAARIRLAAGVTLTASVTALALRMMFRHDPLTWWVPAVIGGIALLVMLGARGSAAAWERRR